jgi:hypothetical protein
MTDDLLDGTGEPDVARFARLRDKVTSAVEKFPTLPVIAGIL